MGLRAKFVGIYTLIFLSVVMVVGVSLQTEMRLQRISEALSLGTGLLEQSRLVRRITNDVLFASFSPDTYSTLKDVLYFESFGVALRTWESESTRFKGEFRAFMDDATVRDLVLRGVLKDEYDTAEIMSLKAFDQLDGLRRRVSDIQARGLLGADLYERIQQSSDPDLIALFDEARQTSYYLANSFERFLNYFIEALAREAVAIRSDLLRSFLILGLATAIVATLVTLVFSSRIVKRLYTLGDALKRTASGDFSTPLAFDTRDEFRDLARSFNDYAETLKINLSAMVTLARRMAGRAFVAEREADATGGLDAVTRVLRSVTEAVLGAGDALVSGLVSGTADAPTFRFSADLGWLTHDDLSVVASLAFEEDTPPRRLTTAKGGEILAGALVAGDRRFGVLVLGGVPGRFNDLDVIRFGNYVEFAGILADNAATYAELVEERNAEYLALQSQIQPHFMYNVLGGFAALNRMGDRDTLEGSILALKDLLRYSVDHAPEATVGEELAFVRSYCELQKMRFQDRLEWTIQVDAGAENRKMPKLLLQPLVENAIIHGIEPTGDPGRLEIAVRTLGEGGSGGISLTVRDNGAGFDPQSREKGVGLRNVERRLALTYPETRNAIGGKLMLQSAPGQGCVSTIVLPEVDS